MVVQRIDWLFWEGTSIESATHLVAALKCFLTEISRASQHDLPRSLRCKNYQCQSKCWAA